MTNSKANKPVLLQDVVQMELKSPSPESMLDFISYLNHQFRGQSKHQKFVIAMLDAWDRVISSRVDYFTEGAVFLLNSTIIVDKKGERCAVKRTPLQPKNMIGKNPITMHPAEIAKQSDLAILRICIAIEKIINEDEMPQNALERVRESKDFFQDMVSKKIVPSQKFDKPAGQIGWKPSDSAFYAPISSQVLCCIIELIQFTRTEYFEDSGEEIPQGELMQKLSLEQFLNFVNDFREQYLNVKADKVVQEVNKKQQIVEPKEPVKATEEKPKDKAPEPQQKEEASAEVQEEVESEAEEDPRNVDNTAAVYNTLLNLQG